MAVYGVGALYGGENNMLPDFIRQSVACVGWDDRESRTAHKIMQSVKTGDIIFIKSFNQSHGLFVKAAGIVNDNQFRKITDRLGYGVGVRWAWCAENSECFPTEAKTVRFTGSPIPMGKRNDKFDFMRNGTVYEEFDEEVIRLLINLIVNDPHEARGK